MDKELESVIALSAELAQVKAERDEAERLCRELAVGLTIFGQHRNPCPASYGIVTIKCDCGFEALLSRPEVVKLLEEKS